MGKSGGSAVLDPLTIGMLRALAGRSGKPLLESVAREFASSDLVDGLAVAASAGEIEAVRRAAHKLKGRSSMVGAARLTELAGSIESNPEEFVANKAQETAIREEYRKVVERLREEAEGGE